VVTCYAVLVAEASTASVVFCYIAVVSVLICALASRIASAMPYPIFRPILTVESEINYIKPLNNFLIILNIEITAPILANELNAPPTLSPIKSKALVALFIIFNNSVNTSTPNLIKSWFIIPMVNSSQALLSLDNFVARVSNVFSNYLLLAPALVLAAVTSS
jgi:hypothetical protein